MRLADPVTPAVAVLALLIVVGIIHVADAVRRRARDRRVPAHRATTAARTKGPAIGLAVDDPTPGEIRVGSRLLCADCVVARREGQPGAICDRCRPYLVGKTLASTGDGA